MVQLTDYLKLSNAAHIFYLFEDRNLYLDNLIAYVKGGMERDHHLLIIENSDIYKEAAQRIDSLFSSEQKKRIHYLNNYLFYRQYGVFHTHKIIEHFGEMIHSFLNEKDSIRTWAHVEWNEQDDIIRILKEYEDLADCCVNDFGLMSVCAYNSSDLCASLQTNMMRSHKYLMTDTEFVRSPLYKNI
ncbi:MEDS domain-containing protein [Ammoniphilus sp. CFH 90114]|uniref:MEDS domain-containing protein n=1 Tax=Ammoniphilus sp. CFH 90114 TaxID=2493665 RepID=UPI00100FCB15|nr:MEDS domain-containing protein [Ammoniphilus sp. CFH 90114]